MSLLITLATITRHLQDIQPCILQNFMNWHIKQEACMDVENYTKSYASANESH